MSVTNVEKDANALTLTVTAEYDADVKSVWQVWADPRTLERWWGPPTWPATFIEHDLTPGGRATYYMTGPEGQRMYGCWQLTAVDEPSRIEFLDAFTDEAGTPKPDEPTNVTLATFAERDGGGTRMVIQSTFPSADAMAQLLEMGMEQGLTEAMGQIDALLA